jgi:hypothetical protein
MRTKRTKGYMDEVAKIHGVRTSQVNDVAESMFRFVATVISEGDKKLLQFGEIRLFKWGVFKVKEGRRKFFKKLNDEKSARNT